MAVSCGNHKMGTDIEGVGEPCITARVPVESHRLYEDLIGGEGVADIGTVGGEIEERELVIEVSHIHHHLSCGAVSAYCSLVTGLGGSDEGGGVVRSKQGVRKRCAARSCVPAQ